MGAFFNHRNYLILVVGAVLSATMQKQFPDGAGYYSFLIDIIPKRGIMLWKARVAIYVYDGKTGCREMGDF